MRPHHHPPHPHHDKIKQRQVIYLNSHNLKVFYRWTTTARTGSLRFSRKKIIYFRSFSVKFPQSLSYVRNLGYLSRKIHTFFTKRREKPVLNGRNGSAGRTSSWRCSSYEERTSILDSTYALRHFCYNIIWITGIINITIAWPFNTFAKSNITIWLCKKTKKIYQI